MSDLTDLAQGKITFSQFVAKATAWTQALIAHDPNLTAVSAAVLSDVKQAASDAVGMADTYVGAAIMPAAAGVEVALDAALAKLTGGVSIPFNGFVNDGIDKMATAVKAEADAWALKTKAALAPKPAA